MCAILYDSAATEPLLCVTDYMIEMLLKTVTPKTVRMFAGPAKNALYERRILS